MYKYSSYHYNKSGNIIVTDTLKSAPRSYKANAVVEVSKNNGSVSRYYYDSAGIMTKHIDNSAHGNTVRHNYGTNGEHAHDYTWENGKVQSRTTRELTATERKENSDIL